MIYVIIKSRKRPTDQPMLFIAPDCLDDVKLSDWDVWTLSGDTPTVVTEADDICKMAEENDNDEDMDC